MIAAAKPSRTVRLADWLLRLGGAPTGDAPHRYQPEWPFPWRCFCDRAEDHPVHAGRALADELREMSR